MLAYGEGFRIGVEVLKNIEDREFRVGGANLGFGAIAKYSGLNDGEIAK